ncbi:helix-turn-helix domain-containing protein, partial [Myxococcota bacterium]|nr:helix-turn-helix domain-containing protein [Myxococcota bacterium]
MSGLNLYERLEIDPGASDDEVRRAYKRLTQLFSPSGVVCYGLYRAEEIKALLEDFKAAYETLVDPERRRRYDQQLYPQGHPSARAAEAVKRGPPRPALPADPLSLLDLPQDAVIDGPVLAMVRQLCQVPLAEIAERTKISMFTLRCIEEPRYADLPAPVYLRGFLKQIATLLHLDGDRVVREYMH